MRVRSEDIEGFRVYTLENENCSLSVVPELGGRIVSILDKTANREWLDGWAPPSERRLRHPADPTDFTTGPFAGADECLPTVLPCQLDGVEIPDHGDLWNQSTHVDTVALEKNILLITWKLRSLPFLFTRSIRLEDREITASYSLENLSENTTPFLWAWHPLFTIEEGDRIEVPDQPQGCQTPEGDLRSWPEAAPGQNLSSGDLGSAPNPCAKVFLGPLQQGRASIAGKSCALSLHWPADLFPWAGIWISRGFSQGHHHWAIEPTNAPVDHLDKIDPLTSFTQLGPHQTRTWDLQIHLESPSNESASLSQKESPR